MTKTALLLIDIQNDYFAGGKLPLEGMAVAAQKAANLLEFFRERKMTVIHVQHISPTTAAPFFHPNSEGILINTIVTPLEDEAVVVKHTPNSFRDTNLKQILNDADVGKVIIAGAMSNMCIDAVTRAAFDFGFSCSVAHDACAAMGLEFNGVQIPAEQVHASFMAALGLGYANVATTEGLINSL